MADAPFLQDIDQNEAEKKQAMLAAIIDSSEDAIISKTLEGYITSWNQAATRLFGYTEEEAIGKHISLLIPKERLKEEDMIIDRIRNGHRVQHFQTIRVTKSGTYIPLSLTISPIKNSQGAIIGASKIARDISEQLRIHQEAQKLLQNTELLLSVGRIISEKLDLHSILQNVTDITTQLTGAEFGAFFYNMINDQGEAYMLYTLSGAPKEAFEKLGMPRNTAVFARTFSGEGILRSDDIRKDPRYGHSAPHYGMPEGHLPVVSYLAVPVTSPSGVIGGLFFGHSQPAMFKEEHERLISGIASQAAVAIENAKLYEEVKSLSTLKDDFIGVAGHELRTPITTIKGYLQLLEGQSTEGLTRDFIEKALRQVNKLNRLITDLLDVTKIQAGKLDYTITPCSIIDLVKECIETVWQIHTSHIIESRLPDKDVIVMADASKIEQVLINLLTNAIKYSPGANKVFLTVTTNSNYAIVSVRDLGIGIPQEHIQHIFHRYYRVKTTQHVVGGLGIGMYISKEIINRHNGEIWLESVENQGSTFFFSLPLAP
ncbi:MAG: PAS domain S-box protein [Bacteroidetes bacterium]|nr:PAS domain S-box protein [Bacteroidota bacterium]